MKNLTRKATIKWLNADLLHIETELGIVNIHLGLSNEKGKVEAIEILADGDRYSGETPKWIEGEKSNNAKYVRIIETPLTS